MSSEPVEGTEKRDARAPRQADGWGIFSTLLAGVLVWTGIGWTADWLLGFDALFLPIGAVLGLVGSVYLIVAKSRQA
ncbi:AtpZ/AtpI family protein [Nocardiopsis salina]|uniref:AtpZ/AtpI family protein n=1 Tax=Nocardiopsis salina TaxID=245836 RepID=UPI00037E8D68|nr:hypothetical protein [Nocardiopsis salina]